MNEPTLSANTANERNNCILSATGMRAGYGKKNVLKDISFEVAKGNVVAIIGPNGSGKSTVLRTIFGLVRDWGGEIEFNGESCAGQKPSELIRRGLVFMPQGNRVFVDLTVQQNLTVSLQGVGKTDAMSRLGEVAAIIPTVNFFMKKRAGDLSGGEKQQVALAMGLMKKPRMLLLDEPSLGLAPNLTVDVFEHLHRINTQMGVTILVVEHKLREVFQIADWVLGLRRGEIVEEGKPEAMDDTKLKDLFLG